MFLQIVTWITVSGWHQCQAWLTVVGAGFDRKRDAASGSSDPFQLRGANFLSVHQFLKEEYDELLEEFDKIGKYVGPWTT